MPSKPGISIRETHDIYISSILHTDIGMLMSTVTQGHDFCFIDNCGTVIDSPEGYRRFHEKMFAQKGWTISFELIQCEEGTEYGYTLTKYHYEEATGHGEPYISDAYLTLIFRMEWGMWKLIHDQITQIRRGRA